MWGGVGRGKTYMMDVFYEALPVTKTRLHFHRFMQRVHEEMKTTKQQTYPLKVIAQRLSAQARVLCLDEFHVSDIADAMLLAGLLEGMFERGMTVVTTSNLVPDQLYKEGLQRARFLPAIALLNKYTEVIHVDGPNDYRLRALEQAEIYHCPLDAGADDSLERSFTSIGAKRVVEGGGVEILGRTINTVRRAEGVVWFDFTQLCDGPRSASDYIELARLFHTIVLSNIPVIAANESDRAQRFISLIDELYDRNVNLIASAAAQPAQLYCEGRKLFEFQRTVSRLQEMQSRAYLARVHLP
ncbi:MAG: cell division protein ZapE [Gammaproteobacteria bacterium]